MKKMSMFALVVFTAFCMVQMSSAQSLEGTWERTITFTTECPSLPPVTDSFTDTVTYTEFDTAIELPEEYQYCELEGEGNDWSLDCTYDEEIEFCTYHFHLQGSGGLEGDEFNFDFTASYTVSGGVGCQLIPLCDVTGEIHGERIFSTSVEDPNSVEIGIPDTYRLFQNYPNPFNPTTEIRYQIADDRSSVHTTLKIYNILGQEVRTLVHETKEPGYYVATWDGRDVDGKDVSSGFYFYRLEVGEIHITKCMLLLK